MVEVKQTQKIRVLFREIISSRRARQVMKELGFPSSSRQEGKYASTRVTMLVEVPRNEAKSWIDKFENLLEVDAATESF